MEGDDRIRFDVRHSTVSIGSNAQVDIHLGGLIDRHATLTHLSGPKGDEFVLMPIGRARVKVNDAAVTGTAIVRRGDIIGIGRYSIGVSTVKECVATPKCAELEPYAVEAYRTPIHALVIKDSSDNENTLLLANGVYRIGSDEQMDIVSNDLEPFHGSLWLFDDGYQVSAGEGEVRLNGEPITENAALSPRDELYFGDHRIELSRLASIDAIEAAAQASAARDSEFTKTAYRFCHDESFGKNDKEVAAQLCALFDESNASTCPAAAKSCPWTTSPRSSWLPRLRIPSTILRIVFIAALVGAIIWFVALILRAGWEDQLSFESAESNDVTLDLQQLPEARSQVLLRRANDALAGGDAKRAAILGHLAILRHLDDTGFARYHPSKTNGDYGRAIRRHKGLHQLFRQVSRQTERIRFGDGQVDTTELQSALSKAPEQLRAYASPDRTEPEDESGAVSLSRGGIDGALSVLVIGVLTLGSACTELPNRPYHSHAPDGMAALPKLLEAAELDVHIGRWKFDRLPEDTSVVVFRTTAALSGDWPDDLSLDPLLERMQVVIIDDALMAHRFMHGVSRRPFSLDDKAKRMAGPRRPSPCVPDALVEAGLDDVTLIDDGALEVGPRNRVITSSVTEVPLSMTAMLGEVTTSTTGGRSIMWAGRRLGAGQACVYLLNQRTLLTNASLTRPENAAFVAAFFASVAGPAKKVVLLDRLDSSMGTGGDDDPDRNRLFVASNMLPFLVQSLVLLLLLLVALGAAFGPLRDQVVTQHKAFVEHVEALGQHYARSGRRGLTHSAHSLARLVVNQNRERVRAGTAGGWGALVRDLAEKHDLPEEDVRAALRLGVEGTTELGTPSPSDPPPHSEQILRTLNVLLSGRDGHRQFAAKKPVFQQRRPRDT